MKSLIKLSFIVMAFTMMFASCSKENKSGESSDGDKSGITTIEDQLGAPGSLNGYVELVPGDVKLEYSSINRTVVVCAKVKVLKAGDCSYPGMKVQLLDGEKNVVADFELTPESKDALSANLKQAGNVANLQFGEVRHEYDEGAAKQAIEEFNGKAKYVVISMTDGMIKPLEEEIAEEATPATGAGSYTMGGTVAGKQVGAMFEIAESGIVRGGYHYGKGTSGDMIELKGAYDPSDNSMVVKEEYNGKVTGTWDLVLSTDDLGNTTLNGTMTNYKGNTYPVLLSTGEVAEGASMASSSTSGANNIDELLDEYERYMTQLASMSKKAMSGDLSALNDYQSLVSTAERIDNKLANMKGEMTPAQAARLSKIAQKAAGM